MSGDNPEILMGKEGRNEGEGKGGHGREKGTGVPRGRDNELSPGGGY